MLFEETPKPGPPAQAAMASSDVLVNQTTENAVEGLKTTIEGPKRMGRPRSKVACRECRRRKVRCDVYQRGAPCTNCHLDGSECTVLKRRRRKPHETTLNTPETIGSLLNGKLRDVPNHSRTDSGHLAGRTSSGDTWLLENQQSGIDILEGRILDGYIDCLHARAVSESSLGKFDATTAFSKVPVPLQELPSYIHCDLSHVSKEDISYLQGKGCFTLPKKDLLDDLLKCFFDYVHPHVPFLDEQEFWETYLDRDSRSQHFYHTDGYRISLLLFQAVLFAATTCAPLSVLRRAGYTSRRVARRAAFYRVRALYSLDAERDKMVLLQALLLMSFWRGGSDEDKDGWHWSGLAISVASDLCLHGQSDAHFAPRQKTLRRRCWWSCVLRDRLLALSERRAPRIQLDQYDVPWLTLADYNVGLRCAISELSPEEELGKRTALSMFSIQLIRLVSCIGNEFPSHSKDLRSSSLPALETWARTRLATRNDDSSMTGFADLDFWRLNLPEVLQRPTDPAGDDTVLSCILVHRNTLEIYYHKLILAICMPRLLSAASQSELEHNSRLARRSSTALAERYDELVDRDSIHCLPGECFGSPTCLDQTNTQTALSFEPTQSNEAHMARVYSPVTARVGMMRPPSLQWTTSNPPASEIPTRRGAQRNRSTDSITLIDLNGLKQPHGLAQEGVVKEDGLDSMMNIAPDTFWTLEDIRSCDEISRFSDPAVDEPSSCTSDTTAPTPSTLPSVDALLSPGSAKVAEESSIGSLDVTDNDLATWANMVW